MAELLDARGAALSDDWADLPRAAEVTQAEAARWVLAPENTVDPDAIELPLPPGCVGIELTLPKFTDGRAYSQARRLRERGYAGPLRASGEVLVDQALLLRRCGFDQLALAEGESVDAVRMALAAFAAAYQPSAADEGLKSRRGAAPA